MLFTKKKFNIKSYLDRVAEAITREKKNWVSLKYELTYLRTLINQEENSSTR